MRRERKKIRERGKLKLSRMFQKFEAGEKVAVVREISLKTSIPKRMQGRTGIIYKKRGNCYVVQIMDNNQEKKYIIHPIHLKRIKNLK